MSTYKILVVEDEKGNRLTTIKYLESSNSDYQILEAENGEQACEIAAKEQPDLIIMDWVLSNDGSKMTGIDALKQLHSQEATKETAVIVASGYMTSSQDLNLALEAGAVDYLRKPIDQIELLARTRSALMLVDSKKEIKRQQSLEKERLEALLEAERKINDLNSERLNQKISELNTIAESYVRKNEGLKRFRTKLIKIEKQAPEDIRPKIKQLVQEIRIEIKQAGDWTEIKKYFEQVYPGFLDRLSSAHPSLTTYDHKICAYLRMNISTKDMSELLNITVPSAEISRVRLRKKLDLPQGKNLSKYINEL